jgi:hypothetical protein
MTSMTIEAENLLFDISSGKYDSSIEELLKSVEARVTEMRKSRTNKDFGIGDKVKFNTYCGTKYLHGHTATVVGLKQKKVLVTLDNPMGRFLRHDSEGKAYSLQINVPPSIIDVVK